MALPPLRRVVALGSAIALVAFASRVDAQVSHPHPGMTLDVRGGPIALVVLDLCAAGADVRVTRYEEREATPEQWAQPRGITAAINGDFFDFPGWTYVVGRARGAGADWPAGHQDRETGRPYWEFGPGGARLVAAGSTAPEAGAREIMGGHNVIISNGHTTGPWSAANDGALLNEVVRRTAIGLSADRRHLYLFSSNAGMSSQTVVDTMQAMARESGAPAIEQATNQDGGGSSQLYLAGRGQIVDSGRPVNDHLGVFARGTGAAPFCPDEPPRGAFDAAACDAIHGWAQDPDVPTSAIDVDLYIGGPAGAVGTAAFRVLANDPRTDLCTAIGSCNHAFSLPTPYGFFDNVSRPVYAYGIDSAGGAHTLLGGSPRTLHCANAAPPFHATAGVRRHVTSQTVLAAWHLGLHDVAPMTDAALNAFPAGPDLSPAPVVVTATSIGIDVLEYQTLRHVTNPTSLDDWHFGAATVHPTAAQLATYLTGAPLSTRPFLARGSGAAVYLIDAPPPLWATLVDHDVPATLTYGDTRAVTFHFLNRGSMTWVPGHVWLAPDSPRDHESPLCDPSTWSTCRRAVTVTAATPPGSTGAFTVTLRAPGRGAATDVHECWGLVAQSTHWFSDPGQNGPADDALCQTLALTDEPPPAPDAGPGAMDGSTHADAAARGDAFDEGDGATGEMQPCGCRTPGRPETVRSAATVAALALGAVARRRRRARTRG